MSRNESFEDVLDMLMLEESEPTDEALARWSERYPEYREDLADFFATWASTENRTEPEPDTDEEWIVQQSASHAMEILRRQGRLAPKRPIPTLSAHDQFVLTAIYLLGGKGYPVTITMKVSEMMGKQALLGSVYVSLDRLQTQGLALSRLADPKTEPENQTRRYFTVTMAGERELAHARETSTLVARFLPDFA